MDFYQELLITALLSILLAFLLGTLFSASDSESDRPDTADDREPAREVKAESADKEIEIGSIGHEKTCGDGGGGRVKDECKGDGEVEIRSRVVGMEKVDDGLLEEEERFLCLAKMGGEGLLGAEESTVSAATGVESDVEIQVNQAKEMLENPTCSDLGIVGNSWLEGEERPEKATGKGSRVPVVEGSITMDKLVKDDEGRFENLGIVEEKNVVSTEKEIVEDLNASRFVLLTGVGEAKTIVEGSHDSDLLGEGRCLLEQEKSEQVSTLGSNMGTEKISQVSGIQGSTTRVGLVKENEERENLGIVEEKNVRPTEEEIIADLEARWVGLEIEGVREAEEILEVPRDSDFLGEGNGLLEEEEERTERASSNVGGNLVNNDESRPENPGIADEKNVVSTEKEIVEDLNASRFVLETGVGEAKTIVERSHDSDLLGEGRCLLEEEKSEQASTLGSNMGTEKISQVSEIQGSTTRVGLVKDNEERENLGIVEEKNVRPTEEEIIVDLEARWVGLEIEGVREAEEILEVPRDSDFLGEGKGLLEEEERTERASSNVGGNLVNNDESRPENPRIAEEKNVGSTKEGVVLEEGSEIEAEKETGGVVDKGNEQSFLNEEDEWEGIEKTEVEKLFSKAAAYVGSESGGDELSKLSGDDQLHLYGLYKVATEGPCYDSQPMALKVSARAKWNAWQKLGHINPEGAMEQYMNLLSEKIPGWKGEKPEGDIEPGEGQSAEEAPPGTSILSTSLNLNSQLDSEIKRAPEGPSCSDEDK